MTTAAISNDSVYQSVIECLRVEAAAIDIAADNLDPQSVNSAIALLNACTGKVIVTGVGKSGVIAQKIAQTLTSTGTAAIFMHPSDALHGSLGMVSGGDVVIALSNSGETEELIAILPTFQQRNAEVISIVGDISSTLGKISKVALDASVDKEACSLNLAPTASTTVALAIGDALAVALMNVKGLTTEDFASNHPSGRLGKRLTVRVADLMHPSPEIRVDANWLDVVKAISSYALGAVNVVDNDRSLLGIVTDGDLRRTVERTSSAMLDTLSARDMMTPDPITVDPLMLAYDALRLMEERSSQISVLPVVDGFECVGLLRIHDIVRHGI